MGIVEIFRFDLIGLQLLIDAGKYDKESLN